VSDHCNICGEDVNDIIAHAVQEHNPFVADGADSSASDLDDD
jgi:PP-loop superfamily ATP-utilizing enzyme